MKIYHIVKTYFSKSRPQATQEWLEARFKFFKEHTLKSLQVQTFQDFRLWVCCQQGMTPHNMANLSPDSPHAIYTYEGEHFPLTPKLRDSDYVYVTRLDSDDLLAPTALEHVNDLVPDIKGRTEAAAFGKGYMYDTIHNRLGVYYNPSPPFHTLMFPTEAFCNKEAYDRLFVGDHSKVKGRYHMHKLPDWQFTVLIHDKNIASDFNYSVEPLQLVPANWSIDQFLNKPVVFDVDDFCDEHEDCIQELLMLRGVYSNFKCTLFTIPNKTSEKLLDWARANKQWIELAVHGIDHDPLDEMLKVKESHLTEFLKGLDYSVYAKGFRPPGWYLTPEVIAACNNAGLWCAINRRDMDLASKFKHGHYVCDERFEAWHGHTHDVCGNWLRAHVNDLSVKWPTNQRFAFVSEAVLK